MLCAIAGKVQSYILLPETRGDVKQNQRFAGWMPVRPAAVGVDGRLFLIKKTGH
jgi:hypothetical protein